MITVYSRKDEGKIDYDYDEAGNRTRMIVNGDVTDYKYYEDTNKLKTDGEYAYVYDEAGNLVKKGNSYNIEGDNVTFTETEGRKVEYYEYTYNLQGRLAEVTRNGEKVAEFIYDTDGMRIKSEEKLQKEESFQTTNYVYSQRGDVLVEDTGSSNGRTSYVYAFEKTFARVDGTVTPREEMEITYFHHDTTDSTRLMTDADGEVTMDQDYLPFGGDLPGAGKDAVVNEDEESYKYTGQKEVVSIGLYYYGARYYDPGAGRFITRDSYRGKQKNPQSLNQYVYALNNPLRYTDPTGYFVKDMAVKSWDSFKEIGALIWDGAQNRYEHKFDSVYDFTNFALFGIPDGIVGIGKGYVERGKRWNESPYHTANWLSSGLLDTVHGTFNPEEPLSAEHWLNSLGTATLMTGAANAYVSSGASAGSGTGQMLSGIGDDSLVNSIDDVGEAQVWDDVGEDGVNGSKLNSINNEQLPSWIKNSFKDGNYSTVVTNDDITVSRVFGGKAEAKGAFATTKSVSNRIQAKMDLALSPEWGNSRMYEATINIPKGTKLNIGKVAPQVTKSGHLLHGGAEQVLLPEKWSMEWIQNIKTVPSK